MRARKMKRVERGTCCSGSYQYTGRATGGFTPNVWVRTDLPLNAVEYTSTDFNGDSNADLIITTASDSCLCTGWQGAASLLTYGYSHI